MMKRGEALALAMAGLALIGAAPPVKPWVPNADIPCDWWLSGPNGKELHASIGVGGAGEPPVLTIADPAFLRFGEEQRPLVELRTNGQAARSVSVESWSTHFGTETAMLGLFLIPRARRVLGGARRLQIIYGGKVLADIPLAATPNKAAIDRCVQPPGKGDSE